MKNKQREVPKPSCQGPKISTCLMLFSNLHREKEGEGEVVGCDMSGVVTPEHSMSKGFWGNTSMRDCQL